MTAGEVTCSISSFRNFIQVTSTEQNIDLDFFIKYFFILIMTNIFFILILHFGINVAYSSISHEISEIDPKEAFFRYLRFSNSQLPLKPFQSNSEHDHFLNIPVPGGLLFADSDSQERQKRSYHVLPSPGLASYFQIHLPTKYKRSEVKNSQYINEFVRFKRNVENIRDKREPEVRTKKMMMDRDLSEPRTNNDRDRESRGAIKEQWIKQPYPVERPDDTVDDNIPSASASDAIRAPRVHFVTTHQRRRPEATSSPVPVPVSTFREREGRSRERDLHLPSYPYPQLQQPQPTYPRPRTYDPYRPQGPRYYEPLPYFQHYDDRDRRYSYSLDMYDDGRSMMIPPIPPPPPPPPPPNKQHRRIIYYATLPEVVRNPLLSSSGNAEQRYSYRSGHDDQYHRPDYRNQLQLQKQRDHDFNSNTKHNTNNVNVKTPLYPVKVSTDVSVREPNKNPERRIYSDVDTRFTYKSPNDGNF